MRSKFEPYYVTSIRTEVDSKKVRYNEREYNLNFFVISGKPEYKEDYTKSYHIDFFLFFYDVTSQKSYDKMKENLKEVKNMLFLYPNKCANFFVVGNKIDLPKNNRKIQTSEAESFCNERKLEFFEISVKSNLNSHKIIEMS